jgi:hypothetical protein
MFTHTHVNARQTYAITIATATHTQSATQYHARQKNPATQSHGVYQWHFDHEVHWFEPSSAQFVQFTIVFAAQSVHFCTSYPASLQ